MAQSPKPISGRRLSTLLTKLRGNFEFRTPEVPEVTPDAYGSPELLSQDNRAKLLTGALKADQPHRRQQTIGVGALLDLASTSLNKVSHIRLENRKILSLMPEVAKAGRLMTASILSPNDLSRHNISVVFDGKDISDSDRKILSDAATEFFQDKLALKTSVPKWIFEAGYESGATILAVIPLKSFEDIHNTTYIGQEAFVKTVVEPLSQDNLFGFGDGGKVAELKHDMKALESFGLDAIFDASKETVRTNVSRDSISARLDSSNLLDKLIGQEALSLTDNPSILQSQTVSRAKRAKKTKDTLQNRYRPVKEDHALEIDATRDTENLSGDPITMKLPPESVSVIHTPGNPLDHQGYLVLLDHTGNPIDATAQGLHNSADTQQMSYQQADIFSQVYSAYGINQSDARTAAQTETMSRIYTHIVSKHITNRLGKAGFDDAAITNSDALFRCMFTRLLQKKKTRILFLPKDLVTYLAFEYDDQGQGVSRLEGIKFNLGMKMAVQVSRVLAVIRAAMDKRKIDVRVGENFMEQPETFLTDVMRQYVSKQSMNFSCDPAVIQNQINTKSISIKASDVPGLETFDITNESDTRTGSFDFDPQMAEYLDKATTNGLRVPAAAMNSLDENDYARSVTTTNLFFSMDVSIDQDVVIKDVTDHVRKYAAYSKSFRDLLISKIPSLGKPKETSSTDDTSNQDGTEDDFPAHYTIDDLIDQMRISLPIPSVAPSKAQFESVSSMTTSINELMTVLFPDDLAGPDDKLRSAVALLRSRFASDNIRKYLENSGMANLTIPDTNFAGELKDLGQLADALHNVSQMLNDKMKIATPAVDPSTDPNATPDGYA